MKNEHAHTLTEAHSLSVNVANHPHILVLPGRELPEDKQQLLSHHLTLFFYIHYPLLLFLLITVTSPSPPFPMLPLPLSAIVTTPPLPQFSISPLYLPPVNAVLIFHEASAVISPYLLIPTLTPSFSFFLASLLHCRIVVSRSLFLFNLTFLILQSISSKIESPFLYLSPFTF